MAGGRLIPVRVGGVEIEVETVGVAGTEATSGRVARAADTVADAFSRAQDTILEVARSTALMIERAGAGARPDRVEVEFGLKFSASGGVVMAGVAGEASLKVTLGYDVARGAGERAGTVLEGFAARDGDEDDDDEGETGVGADGGADGRVGDGREGGAA